MTVSRKDRRERLVSHFTTDLTGTGNPVEAVFGHDRRDFKTQSPVVLVLSEGIARTPFGLGQKGGTGKFLAPMRFAVLSFVKEADDDAGWTSQNVEDALDSVEAAIAASVMAHRIDIPYWHNLMYVPDYSVILPVTVGGKPYKMEQFLLEAEVKD